MSAEGMMYYLDEMSYRQSVKNRVNYGKFPEIINYCDYDYTTKSLDEIKKELEQIENAKKIVTKLLFGGIGSWYGGPIGGAVGATLSDLIFEKNHDRLIERYSIKFCVYTTCNVVTLGLGQKYGQEVGNMADKILDTIFINKDLTTDLADFLENKIFYKLSDYEVSFVKNNLQSVDKLLREDGEIEKIIGEQIIKRATEQTIKQEKIIEKLESLMKGNSYVIELTTA